MHPIVPVKINFLQIRKLYNIKHFEECQGPTIVPGGAPLVTMPTGTYIMFPFFIISCVLFLSPEFRYEMSVNTRSIIKMEVSMSNLFIYMGVPMVQTNNKMRIVLETQNGREYSLLNLEQD